MTLPTVSVVIPAHQAEAWVSEAIESVLAQTVPVHECLVVDDGSTDGTAAAARRFSGPVRVIRQGNTGVSGARNRGAREATGTLLAFLDADDAWAPPKLERQLDALAGADAVAAFTGAVAVRADGATRPIQAPPPGTIDLEDLLVHRSGRIPAQIPSSLLLEAETFRRVGPWDETLSDAADWDYAIRLRRLGRFTGPSDALVRYRVHGAAMSGDVARRAADVRRLFDKLERDHEVVSDVGRATLRRARARNVVVSAAGLAAAGREAAAATLLASEATRRPLATVGALWRRAIVGREA